MEPLSINSVYSDQQLKTTELNVMKLKRVELNENRTGE